jgi:NADH-quinone oxidoreductase subunit G
VLGNLLKLPGFEYDSIEGVRADCLATCGDVATRLNNAIQDAGESGASEAQQLPVGLERIGEVPIYQVDGIVRRAESLQLTRDAQNASVVSLPGIVVEKLGLRQDDHVRIVQQGGEAVLRFRRDDRLPDNCVRIPGACPETSGLGPLFGPIELQRVPAKQKAIA